MRPIERTPRTHWVVKRGRCITVFHNFSAAYRYWHATLGSTLSERGAA